jgi:hypothetical protein
MSVRVERSRLVALVFLAAVTAMHESVWARHGGRHGRRARRWSSQASTPRQWCGSAWSPRSLWATSWSFSSSTLEQRQPTGDARVQKMRAQLRDQRRARQDGSSGGDAASAAGAQGAAAGAKRRRHERCRTLSVTMRVTCRCEYRRPVQSVRARLVVRLFDDCAGRWSSRRGGRRSNSPSTSAPPRMSTSSPRPATPVRYPIQFRIGRGVAKVRNAMPEKRVWGRHHASGQFVGKKGSPVTTCPSDSKVAAPRA